MKKLICLYACIAFTQNILPSSISSNQQESIEILRQLLRQPRTIKSGKTFEQLSDFFDEQNKLDNDTQILDAPVDDENNCVAHKLAYAYDWHNVLMWLSKGPKCTTITNHKAKHPGTSVLHSFVAILRDDNHYAQRIIIETLQQNPQLAHTKNPQGHTPIDLCTNWHKNNMLKAFSFFNEQTSPLKSISMVKPTTQSSTNTQTTCSQPLQPLQPLTNYVSFLAAALAKPA